MTIKIKKLNRNRKEARHKTVQIITFTGERIINPITPDSTANYFLTLEC